MTETNLKPCPFCGGTANIAKWQIEFWAYCPHCGAQTELYETEQEVAKAWNTRQIEDYAVKYEPTSYSCRACKNATDEEIKRLREALEVILEAAQKDEPCVLAIKAVAYMALKGGKE